MRYVLAIIVALHLSSVAAAEDTSTALQGEWEVVHYEYAGKVLSPEEIDTLGVRYLRFTDKSFMNYTRRMHSNGKFDLKATSEPMEITFNIEIGEFARDQCLGICELKHGVFKLCYSRPGLNRPKEFRTVEGKERTYVVYRRKEKPRRGQ
jgi:uncharacterized protein (TIGR03067 family)